MDEIVFNGVIVTPQRRVSNPKGDIIHAMKRSGMGYAGFGEAYFSTVHYNVVKGWKCHRTATLNLTVPVGLIRFVIYDSRTFSPSKGKFFEVIIGEDNYSRITISPGLWVAFMGISEGLNMLLNISSEEHDPDEADNIDLNEIPFDWNNGDVCL